MQSKTQKIECSNQAPTLTSARLGKSVAEIVSSRKKIMMMLPQHKVRGREGKGSEPGFSIKKSGILWEDKTIL